MTPQTMRPIAITKSVGERIRIRSCDGFVLVMDIQKGPEPDTVVLEFSGAGSMIVATESLTDAKVAWVISPNAQEE